MTRNLDLARRKDIDRPWNDYPIGTKALSCTGGYWTRIERGWKWATGSIFQTPGAEIGRVYSTAAHERAMQAEAAGAAMDKVWRRSGKLRPRLPHALADGQRVALDKPFRINGVLMMHPHDPTAPASETVNCGCVVLYRPRGWAQTTPDHKPYTDAELALDPRMAEIEEARREGKPLRDLADGKSKPAKTKTRKG